MTPDLQKSLDVIRRWLADIDGVRCVQPSLTSEERKQLLAVNRSIEQLQKGGVAIPDELRKLKLRLGVLDTSDTANPAREINLETLDELIDSLRDLVSVAKKIRVSIQTGHKIPGTKINYGVQLVELIEAGFLNTESRLELQWLKDGEIFEGKLRTDGQVAVRTASGWKEYDSLSSAASGIAGCSLNGWKHWRLVEANGKHIPLAVLRERYVNKRQS